MLAWVVIKNLYNVGKKVKRKFCRHHGLKDKTESR